MKLLIIRPSALGDTLMLMPAIAQLRGSTEIVLVGRSPGVDIISPYVNSVIDYEGSGWHRLFLEHLDVDHAFSLPEADCTVAFLSDPDGNVNRNLKAYLPKSSVHFFPAFPPEESSLHVAFYLAQCLKRAGLPADPNKCLAEAGERPLLKDGGLAIQKKKIVFHPGSGGKGKNHPPDFWLELIGKLNSHFPLPSFSKSIILLGPAEEQLLPFFTSRLDGVRSEILFAPELEQLQSILSQAPLYVGHDSGITHLAAMLGTPTIALFKNSSMQQWRPLGPVVRVIKNEEGREALIRRTLKEASVLIGKRSPSSTFPAK
ncbi:MAG: glycosyltransferase family 9 protein [Desulfobacteraceae bacterium]|jgi:ADP-heptose:LPS heptosyltransferase